MSLTVIIVAAAIGYLLIGAVIAKVSTDFFTAPWNDPASVAAVILFFWGLFLASGLFLLPFYGLIAGVMWIGERLAGVPKPPPKPRACTCDHPTGMVMHTGLMVQGWRAQDDYYGCAECDGVKPSGTWSVMA